MQIRSFHVTSNEVILKTRRTNCNAISFPSVMKLMAIKKKSLKAVNILIITVNNHGKICKQQLLSRLSRAIDYKILQYKLSFNIVHL